MNRPFVFINMAMTADGKIASTNGKVNSFGSRTDHARLLELRTKADAILTGAGTLNSQPDITLGPSNKEKNLPIRVIVSGQGHVNPKHKLFQTTGAPVVVLTSEIISHRRLKELETVADTVLVCGTNSVNFKKALHFLSRKYNSKRILCEGGGKLNDSLFRAGLVDEVNLTICPLILGGKDAPTIADGTGFKRLADAVQFKLHSRKELDNEMFLTYRAVRKP
jgi:riboflavin-specific deaminase-like protein